MLQRQSNACKLKTVTTCHLWITGVLSSSASSRHELTNMCQDSQHTQLTAAVWEHFLLSNSLTSLVHRSSILLLCVMFSFYFSSSCLMFFSFWVFVLSVIQHATLQAVVLLSFPLPSLDYSSFPPAPLSVLSVSLVLLLPPFTLLLLPSLSCDSNLPLSLSLSPPILLLSIAPSLVFHISVWVQRWCWMSVQSSPLPIHEPMTQHFLHDQPLFLHSISIAPSYPPSPRLSPSLSSEENETLMLLSDASGILSPRLHHSIHSPLACCLSPVLPHGHEAQAIIHV